MKSVRWLMLLGVAAMLSFASQAHARWFFYRSPGFGNYYPAYSWPYTYYQPYVYPYGTGYYPYGTVSYGYYPGAWAYSPAWSYAAYATSRPIEVEVEVVRRRSTIHPAVLVTRDFDLRDFEPDEKLKAAEGKKPAKH